MVTLEALAPFRSPFVRAAGDPQPLPYLDAPTNRQHGGLDIELEVLIQTQAMRAHCTRSGYRRIGFGDCQGQVLAARR